MRHQQAGVASYVWMSSRDERVRERHRALDGKEYRYGEPAGAEQGLPRGQPIQCRCVARGIVEIDGERF
ncbi:minor capsid protein [Aurantimonas sp. A2-1-M11]|uniref:minor capsid protein n=1 Tax=Aurantimonas sp. A2-1-M11 TaxID=3113712 RepID=UPI003FA57300